ncbi:phage tail protein [Idiomarina abyssalis]|uniref:phage tail protein n=1 Tax=Idiomarina abyssalis TaxID=86102 RepID=UPI001CD435EC|nr:phage tail protein [Idiomarina abyssalis]
MMALGFFVFGLKTASPDSVDEQINWRHASQNRVGSNPAYQFVGQGPQTAKLPGVLYPELTGGSEQLNELRKMADTGKAWPWVDGAGELKGYYFITDIEKKSTSFFPDGTARKIEFSVSLTRADENNSENLAGNDVLSMTGGMGGLVA